MKENLPERYEVIADLPGSLYTFPATITPIDQRPDIVIWSQLQRSAILVELTVCFETNFAQAHNRKSDKYQDLVDAAEANGFDMALITLEAGSRGFLNLHGFTALLKTLSGPT